MWNFLRKDWKDIGIEDINGLALAAQIIEKDCQKLKEILNDLRDKKTMHDKKTHQKITRLIIHLEGQLDVEKKNIKNFKKIEKKAK